MYLTIEKCNVQSQKVKQKENMYLTILKVVLQYNLQIRMHSKTKIKVEFLVYTEGYVNNGPRAPTLLGLSIVRFVCLKKKRCLCRGGRGLKK